MRKVYNFGKYCSTLAIVGDIRKDSIDELARRFEVDVDIVLKAYDDAFARLSQDARGDMFLPVLAMNGAAWELGENYQKIRRIYITEEIND